MSMPQAKQAGSAHTTEELRNIWTSVLGVAAVQERDNFIELGGDSISASTCLSRIRAKFGIDLPITLLLMEDADFGVLVDEVDMRLARSATGHDGGSTR